MTKLTNTSNENNDFSKITIFDLMNHISGILFMPDKIIFKKYKNTTEASKSFINERLLTKERGTIKYSNFGYIILWRIIEQVTNLNYIDAYKKYIFDNLKMQCTDIGKTNITFNNSKNELLKSDDILEIYFASSNEELKSCVDDFIKFSNGCFDLLNKNSLELI